MNRLTTFLEVPGPEEQFHAHAQQDGLFVGGGPTKTDFAFLHSRRVKKYGMKILADVVAWDRKKAY
jgi:hypothetical protein